jgi:hypothetical protein
MKKIAILVLVIAVISFAAAVYTKITLQPLYVLPGGLNSDNFLNFADTCLLLAIVFLLWK